MDRALRAAIERLADLDRIRGPAVRESALVRELAERLPEIAYKRRTGATWLDIRAELSSAGNASVATVRSAAHRENARRNHAFDLRRRGARDD